MTILSATTAVVKIGFIELEGLMDEHARFFIGIPQLVDLDFVPPGRSIKQLEALYSMKFSSHEKLKTPLNSKAINAISLEDFEKLLAKLDRSGNKLAQDMRDDLVGVLLHELCCDAFHLKFDKEDRQEFLKQRQQTKVIRFEETDSIKSYIDRHPEVSENYKKWVYSNVSDKVNLAVFGKKAKELCDERKVKREFLRDSHSIDDLKKIEDIEHHAAKLMNKFDIEPLAAINNAVEFWR